MTNSSFSRQAVSIQPLDQAHIRQVVEIHRQVLGYSMNSRIGPDHLSLLYSVMLTSPDCFVAVALYDSRMVGFVSGTLDPESVKSRFIRSIPKFHWLKILFRLLFLPGLFTEYWHGRKIDQPVHWESHLIAPTLTSIGVLEEFQGLGIGRNLVHLLEDFFRKAKMQVYRLDTLQSNQKAREFYARLGFHEVEKRANSVILVKSLE